MIAVVCFAIFYEIYSALLDRHEIVQCGRAFHEVVDLKFHLLWGLPFIGGILAQCSLLRSHAKVDAIVVSLFLLACSLRFIPTTIGVLEIPQARRQLARSSPEMRGAMKLNEEPQQAGGH